MITVFSEVCLSSGRVGAKNIVHVYPSEGLAMGRSRQSCKNIYSAPKAILSKQCAVGNGCEEACFLKLCRF